MEDAMEFSTNSGGISAPEFLAPYARTTCEWAYNTAANGAAYAGRLEIDAENTEEKDAYGRTIFRVCGTDPAVEFTAGYVPGDAYGFDRYVFRKPTRASCDDEAAILAVNRSTEACPAGREFGPYSRESTEWLLATGIEFGKLIPPALRNRKIRDCSHGLSYGQAVTITFAPTEVSVDLCEASGFNCTTTLLACYRPLGAKWVDATKLALYEEREARRETRRQKVRKECPQLPERYVEPLVRANVLWKWEFWLLAAEMIILTHVPTGAYEDMLNPPKPGARAKVSRAWGFEPTEWFGGLSVPRTEALLELVILVRKAVGE